MKTQIKLITSMMLFKSSFFVSHGKTLSIYSLREEKWSQNIEFEKQIFRIYNDNDDSIYVIFEDTEMQEITLVSTDKTDRDSNS